MTESGVIRLGKRVFRHGVACAVIIILVRATPSVGLGASKAIPNRPEAISRMPRHPVIVSRYSPHDVLPDGDLNKPFWSAAGRVSFDQAGYTRKPYPQSKTEVASRWTSQYLYLAFWCHYQDLNVFEGEDPHVERWGLWEKDVVEAFIAPDPDQASHYFEFEVAPTNQWIDLEIDLNKQPFNNPHWNSGFEHATKLDPARHLWTSEWRIPLPSVTRSGIMPHADWRVNFYRSDGNPPHRRSMSWGALPRKLPQSSFHQPASFGVLRFSRSQAREGR